MITITGYGPPRYVVYPWYSPTQERNDMMGMGLVCLGVLSVMGSVLLYMEYYAVKMQQLEDEVLPKDRPLMLLTSAVQGRGSAVAVPTQIYKIDHM